MRHWTSNEFVDVSVSKLIFFNHEDGFLFFVVVSGDSFDAYDHVIAELILLHVFLSVDQAPLDFGEAITEGDSR